MLLGGYLYFRRPPVIAELPLRGLRSGLGGDGGGGGGSSSERFSFEQKRRPFMIMSQLFLPVL